jgi:aspartate/methionine/tyrosine aminotransferase
MNTISERARKNTVTGGLGKYLHMIAQRGPYHPTDNPNGICDFGVSENKLMDDMIKEKMDQINMTNQWQSTESNILSIDNIVVLNGAGSCFTALSHAIMDENDYLMIQTPYYSGIGFDINAITDNHICPVKSFCGNNFLTTVDDYRRVFNQAKREGKRIKAICIVNPQNPLGLCYTKNQVVDLLNFAADADLHVIIDEIYANCIYDENAEFQSAFSYYDEFPDPMKTHFVWSFSKDLCLAGVRTGVVYSTNQLLIKTLITVGYFFAPSYIIQYNLSQILNDKVWIKTFFSTNLKRLAASKHLMLNELKQLDVSVCPCVSGFYLWVDFRNILNSVSSTITLDLEEKLFEMFIKHGVYIVPGHFLKSPEPGFYRIIFSVPEYSIPEGYRRLKLAIENFKNDLNNTEQSKIN